MGCFYLFAAVFSVVFAQSVPDPKPVPVDSQAFFKRLEGAYEILEAGAKAPKPDNALADITAEKDEGIFTLPYCPATGLCDAGYLFFPYSQTTVMEHTKKDGTLQDDIEFVEADKKYKYTWTQDKTGKFRFRNPYYEQDGKVIILEHVLRRKNPKP